MGSRVVVVGSSNTDMIVKVPQLPKPGETVLGGEFSSAAGGKGANQAVAAARAGGDVTFVARVGDDPFGRQATAGFAADGIDVRYVFVDAAAPSGVALIVVDEGGENSIAVASGANARLTPQDVMTAEDAIASADVLIVQLETPLDAVQTAVRLAHERGVRVVLNPAPAQPLSGTILRYVSVLTPNETEATLLTDIEVTSDAGVLAAAEALHAGGVASVLITLGSRGVFVFDSDHGALVPGFAVEPRDTTGAGDVFNGALAVALAEGRALTEAARFANAAAALAVTTLGAQTSVPMREEIQRFLDSR
jgi:ribokinase